VSLRSPGLRLLLHSLMPRCRRRIPALVVRGFRFCDNMAGVSAPGWRRETMKGRLE
jgi:hypothetical protein